MPLLPLLLSWGTRTTTPRPTIPTIPTRTRGAQATAAAAAAAQMMSVLLATRRSRRRSRCDTDCSHACGDGADRGPSDSSSSSSSSLSAESSSDTSSTLSTSSRRRRLRCCDFCLVEESSPKDGAPGSERWAETKPGGSARTTARHSATRPALDDAATADDDESTVSKTSTSPQVSRPRRYEPPISRSSVGTVCSPERVGHRSLTTCSAALLTTSPMSDASSRRIFSCRSSWHRSAARTAGRTSASTAASFASSRARRSAIESTPRL
mmetsp:Transcript_25978/g.103929  ORF Transcript_25978/g.103929 Transcript_25978/m.103929 type:complete len:267 (-) Transcript_25978:1099-1899(-)